MTPKERYRADLERPGFQSDPAQEAAVEHVQRVYDELVAASAAEIGILDRVRGLFGRRHAPVRGLYLWGGVGRGKTHIVNTLHDSLPFPEKLRIHFHSFMQRVHRELKTLKARQDPLAIVAERLAEQTTVVCFDEFHVSDITDAMLLGRLLEALFARGVTLVATSNIAPDDLYKDGLQRERFLPAIDLIKQHTQVLHLDNEIDYRLRALERAEIYHSPLDERADASLMESFAGLEPEAVQEGQVLEVEGRPIQTVRCADGIVWFDFAAICDSPRAPADYIEIARCFHTVLIAGIPILGPEDNDKTTRFIHLIDEFYDRNVNLIASAAAPPAALYTGGKLASPFRRTTSRLEEMQSREYLARKHLP